MKKIVFLIAALMLVWACASSKPAVDTEKNNWNPPVAKETITVNGVSFNMVAVRAGDFLMGSPLDDQESFDNEHPQHRVSISAFQMGETEVTQGLWKAVMGNNPSHFNECGDNCPVEQVSWNDVREFIKKLNQIVSGDEFRLPTEAEWEYCCRAGTATPFSSGDCLSTDQANYDGQHPLPDCDKGEFRKGTVPVASFSPNSWGFYDMHGNVWEWCKDAYRGDAYSKHKSSNPVVLGESTHRAYRGGGWRSYAKCCRSAIRSGYAPSDSYRYLGFRLSRRVLEK